MSGGFVLFAERVPPRPAEDRGVREAALETALQAVHNLPDVAWLTPLATDEEVDRLSGVLGTPARAFDVAWTINLGVWPAAYRFVLGAGARPDAFDAPFVVDLPGVPSAQAAVVESLARLHDTIVSGWTPREAEIVRRHQALGRQRDVAADLDVSQQAVSKALHRARIHELADARRAVAAWLDAATATLTR